MSNHKEQCILATASSAGFLHKQPAVFGTLGNYINPESLCQERNLELTNYTNFAPLTFTPGPMVEATTQLLIY